MKAEDWPMLQTIIPIIHMMLDCGKSIKLIGQAAIVEKLLANQVKILDVLNDSIRLQEIHLKHGLQLHKLVAVDYLIKYLIHLKISILFIIKIILNIKNYVFRKK